MNDTDDYPVMDGPVGEPAAPPPGAEPAESVGSSHPASAARFAKPTSRSLLVPILGAILVLLVAVVAATALKTIGKPVISSSPAVAPAPVVKTGADPVSALRPLTTDQAMKTLTGSWRTAWDNDPDWTGYFQVKPAADPAIWLEAFSAAGQYGTAPCTLQAVTERDVLVHCVRADADPAVDITFRFDLTDPSDIQGTVTTEASKYTLHLVPTTEPKG